MFAQVFAVVAAIACLIGPSVVAGAILKRHPWLALVLIICTLVAPLARAGEAPPILSPDHPQLSSLITAIIIAAVWCLYMAFRDYASYLGACYWHKRNGYSTKGGEMYSQRARELLVIICIFFGFFLINMLA